MTNATEYREAADALRNLAARLRTPASFNVAVPFMLEAQSFAEATERAAVLLDACTESAELQCMLDARGELLDFEQGQVATYEDAIDRLVTRHGFDIGHLSLAECIDAVSDIIEARLQASVGPCEDSARLDDLQHLLMPNTPATEIFFAGLRSGDKPATEFQCEIAPTPGVWTSYRGKTIREAIDRAIDPCDCGLVGARVPPGYDHLRGCPQFREEGAVDA